MNKRLTEYSKGSGCGCKVAPLVLDGILNGLKQQHHHKLLVGFDHRDDAAVYEFNEQQYLIATLDFFTPVVDDPYLFGKIAAANALSDIYAMGGTPQMALSILGLPVDDIDQQTIQQIIQGAIDTCTEAGVVLAGGHSINNPELFFGLSVNGTIEKKYLKTNQGASAKDLIYITKPIGIGIINAGIKKGIISMEDYQSQIHYMTQLNNIGSELARYDSVHAMTDITGFGLLGHLIEVCEASKLSAQLDLKSIPIHDHIEILLKQNCIPDNTYRNWNAVESKTEGLNDMKYFQLLNDPQTNGGLMIFIQADFKEEFEQWMTSKKQAFACIGSLQKQSDQVVYIKN